MCYLFLMLLPLETVTKLRQQTVTHMTRIESTDESHDVLVWTCSRLGKQIYSTRSLVCAPAQQEKYVTRNYF